MRLRCYRLPRLLFRQPGACPRSQPITWQDFPFHASDQRWCLANLSLRGDSGSRGLRLAQWVSLFQFESPGTACMAAPYFRSFLTSSGTLQFLCALLQLSATRSAGWASLQLWFVVEAHFCVRAAASPFLSSEDCSWSSVPCLPDEF